MGLAALELQRTPEVRENLISQASSTPGDLVLVYQEKGPLVTE
jgi:hypothetical protein